MAERLEAEKEKENEEKKSEYNRRAFKNSRRSRSAGVLPELSAAHAESYRKSPTVPKRRSLEDVLQDKRQWWEERKQEKARRKLEKAQQKNPPQRQFVKVVLESPPEPTPPRLEVIPDNTNKLTKSQAQLPIEEIARRTHPIPIVDGRPQFELTRNFRDLSWSVTGIRAGMFYRSGSPSHASAGDIKTLTQVLGIRTMIDLRSWKERENDDKNSVFRQAFSLMGSVPDPPSRRELTGHAMDPTTVSSPALLETSKNDTRRRPGDRQLFLCGLTGVNFVARLFAQVPLSTAVKSMGHAITGNTEGATLLLVNDLHNRGLAHLYFMFLEYCQRQICEVLTLFLHPENYPIHVFCNLGKDRTGTITALVLTCAGVSREEIIQDYTESRHLMLTEHLKTVVDQTGLRGEFLEAPAEVMMATFTFLERKYGSVQNYLTHIGFGPERQARVRMILSGV
jgi:protein tyrosine/serine phosphatase